MQLTRIRLSDKTSRLHPRHVVPKPGQAYEPEVPVKVREWIAPALASSDLVLEAQPPTQPHSGVVVERPVRRQEDVTIGRTRWLHRRGIPMVARLVHSVMYSTCLRRVERGAVIRVDTALQVL